MEIIQENVFAEEYKKIKKGHVLRPSLQMMTPFIQKFSEAGILLHAPISENAKFPILLPRKNQIVDDDRSFSARNLVVQKCIHCFRYKPVLLNQIMGNQSAFEDQQSQFQLFVVEKGIEWRFIPPRATHFGSLWEAAVKSAKEILVRQVAYYPVSGKIKFHCQKRSHNYVIHIITSEFWVLGTITSNPPDNMRPARQWKIPAGVDLADSEFHKPQRIDILLGADSFFDLLCSGQWFLVSLPFKCDPLVLGSSFDVAKRRFLSLERRSLKDSSFREMYIAIMKEYLELGHMSPTCNKIPPGPHYFISHQCVLRPDSTSTKLLVVFDASAKTTSAQALHDILMVGPTIKRELLLSLVRFRLNRFALTADISKMYRQVSLAEEDRNYQLIVWRENPSDELQIFRLNTAPFLAIRSLQELGVRNRDKHEIGSYIICNDFYVDDMLTGADDIDNLNVICNQVSEFLNSGGFQLSKWFSTIHN